MELYGWDLVYGASVEIINRQLAQQAQTLISTFDYQRTLSDGGVLALQGQFGPWSVVDGNNNLITVRVPIQQGQMTLSGSVGDLLAGTERQPGVPFDVSGVAVLLQLSLGFKTSAQDPHVQKLVFDYTIKGDQPADTDMAVVSFEDPQKKLSSDALSGLLEQAIEEALAAHRDQISFEFASVALQGSSNSAAAPKFAKFYYFKPDHQPVHYFTILAMVNRDNADGVDSKIDPVLFNNTGANLYLGLSKDIFLQGYLQPWLPQAVTMAKDPAYAASVKNFSYIPGQVSPGLGVQPKQPVLASNFKYDAGNHAIVNNGDVRLDNKKDYDPNSGASFTDDDYDPDADYNSITNLKLYVDDNAVKTEMEVFAVIQYDAMSDQSVGLDYKTSWRNVVVYDAGKKAFVLQTDAHPVTEHHLVGSIGADPNDPGSWLNPLGSVVSDVATVAILDAIVSGWLDAFSGSIQLSNLNTVPITWAGSSGNFQVVGGALSGNLWLAGKD